MAGTIKETWPLMDLLLNAKSLKSDPATMTHWTYMAGFAAQSQARRHMCIAFNTPPPPPPPPPPFAICIYRPPPPPPQTRGSRMGDHASLLEAENEGRLGPRLPICWRPGGQDDVCENPVVSARPSVLGAHPPPPVDGSNKPESSRLTHSSSSKHTLLLTGVSYPATSGGTVARPGPAGCEGVLVGWAPGLGGRRAGSRSALRVAAFVGANG